MLLGFHGQAIAQVAERSPQRFRRDGSHLIGGPRFLTSVQRAELRRKLAEVEAKLRQLSAAERVRRR